MMNVKISILSLVLMAGATSLFADNNDKGIDYYKAGMYSYAKKALFENIQSGKTDKAEAKNYFFVLRVTIVYSVDIVFECNHILLY